MIGAGESVGCRSRVLENDVWDLLKCLSSFQEPPRRCGFDFCCSLVIGYVGRYHFPTPP